VLLKSKEILVTPDRHKTLRDINVEGYFTLLFPTMDNEKDTPGHIVVGENAPDGYILETTQAHSGGQRIQFIPPTKPERGRHIGYKEDASTSVDQIRRRSMSVASIPRVVSETEKIRHKIEKEEEKRAVNIDEHLMTHQAVAHRYKTRINMEKPEESLGLTSQQAEQLLIDYGPNILKPPKSRHPLLKYLDCLTSLFNLLLILAGILEYILLGISYKNNFQNVSSTQIAYSALLTEILDISGRHSDCGCIY